MTDNQFTLIIALLCFILGNIDTRPEWLKKNFLLLAAIFGVATICYKLAEWL